MKKILTTILAFVSAFAISQTTVSPQLISSCGGSGDVGTTHFDWSVGEPITLWGGLSTGCDSIFSGFQHCAIDTLRIKKVALTIGGALTFCKNQNVLLTAPTGTAYKWYPGGATTQSYSVTQSGTYHVRVTNSCGDTVSSNSVVVSVINPTVPQICQVSTDSTSNYNYNIIYWEKVYPHVDSFIVYRKDNFSVNYLRLGAVSKDSLSQFQDTMFSIGGPNGGNPAFNSWKYKIAIRDTCGNISSKSPWHQSVFVTQSSSVFNFSAYIDSANTSLPTGYGLYRDDLNNGNWNIIASVGTSPANDPAFSSFPTGNWRIDALGFSCNPTVRLAGGGNNTYTIRQKSHSNTAKQSGTTGVKQITNSGQISIYPNPSSGIVHVQSAKELGLVSVYNSLGEIVYQQSTKDNSLQVDISKQSPGVYFVNVQGKYIKVIKE